MCEAEDGIDICPMCFCAGKEFKQHRRGHSYRVVVSGNLSLEETSTSKAKTLLRNCIPTLSLQMIGVPTSTLL